MRYKKYNNKDKNNKKTHFVLLGLHRAKR